MAMDDGIRALATAVGAEVKGKASNVALADTNAYLARTADSDGANMIKNSAWKDVNATTGLPAGWTRAGAQTAASMVQIAPLAGTVWKFDGVGTQVGAYSPYFDVYSGEVYNYTATVRGAPVGTPTFAMRVEFRDRDNVALTTFAQSFNFPGSAITGTVRTPVTVPEGAVRARIFILHGASATSGSWYLASVEFRRAIAEITSGYLSDASLKSTYVVHRVKTAGVYPARIANAVNMFIGDTDPGLAMSGSDIWVNPDSATYAGVAAAMLDTGSDIRRAMQSESIYIPVSAMIPEDGTTPVTILGSSPDQRVGRVMPNTGVSRLFGGIKFPNTWNTIRVKPHFQHNTPSATAGNVGWLLNITTTPFTAGSSTGTFYLANSAMNIVGNGQSTPVAIPVGTAWSYMVARNGNATSDTFEYPVQFLGVEFIKAT